MQVDVIEDSFRLADLLTFMRGMLLSQGDEFSTQKKIPLNLPYFQDQTITHLEKVFQINSQTDKSVLKFSFAVYFECAHVFGQNWVNFKVQVR